VLLNFHFLTLLYFSSLPLPQLVVRRASHTPPLKVSDSTIALLISRGVSQMVRWLPKMAPYWTCYAACVDSWASKDNLDHIAGVPLDSQAWLMPTSLGDDLTLRTGS